MESRKFTMITGSTTVNDKGKIIKEESAEAYEILIASENFLGTKAQWDEFTEAVGGFASDYYEKILINKK